MIRSSIVAALLIALLTPASEAGCGLFGKMKARRQARASASACSAGGYAATYTYQPMAPTWAPMPMPVVAPGFPVIVPSPQAPPVVVPSTGTVPPVVVPAPAVPIPPAAPAPPIVPSSAALDAVGYGTWIATTRALRGLR